MHVVVTGGAGFIGANLMRTLVDGGHSAVALDNLSTGSKENLDGLDAQLVVGTILDPDVLDEVLADADAVVHLAARPSVPRSIEDPAASHEANATGTLQVLEAARRAGNLHTIVASSSSIYGANPTLPKSEDLRPQPMSPYAVSKLATETYALAYQECFDLPTLAFRFFNVFGPLQPAGHAYAAAMPAFVDAALQGRPLPLNGDGLQTRDFTFVGSVARVITQAVDRTVTSTEPVNLAFGSRRSLRDVIAELGELLGRDLEIEQRPDRPGDVRHSQADQTRLKKLFPDIEPVEFTDALRQTVAWFQKG
ncbi:MAG: NAD-dependent epimerase/dehydratase family protein [Actinobacteria bacterium]|nr:NAD-dependent epimerase/dehydratase family protein [Actinomycetota bacterium]